MPHKKFHQRPEARNLIIQLQRSGKRIVFTNGCFDILHAGHVKYLAAARAMGDALVVGLNSDASIQRIKGPKRPICHEADRVAVLSALESVDLVTIFDEETPEELISELLPDILVKGADWPVEKIAGAKTVLANGGQVLTAPLLEGRSTSALIERILEAYGNSPSSGTA